MSNIYLEIHTAQRPTVDYSPDWELFTMRLAPDSRVVLNLDDAKALYMELEGALRHAYDDLHEVSA
jgi:hypothetical protein